MNKYFASQRSGSLDFRRIHGAYRLNEVESDLCVWVRAWHCAFVPLPRGRQRCRTGCRNLQRVPVRSESLPRTPPVPADQKQDSKVGHIMFVSHSALEASGALSLLLQVEIILHAVPTEVAGSPSTLRSEIAGCSRSPRLSYTLLESERVCLGGGLSRFAPTSEILMESSLEGIHSIKT